MVGVVGDCQGGPGRAIPVLVGDGVAAGSGGRNVDLDLGEVDAFTKIVAVDTGDGRRGKEGDIVGTRALFGGSGFVGENSAVISDGGGDGGSKGIEER